MEAVSIPLVDPEEELAEQVISPPTADTMSATSASMAMNNPRVADGLVSDRMLPREEQFCINMLSAGGCTLATCSRLHDCTRLPLYDQPCIFIARGLKCHHERAPILCNFRHDDSDWLMTRSLDLALINKLLQKITEQRKQLAINDTVISRAASKPKNAPASTTDNDVRRSLAFEQGKNAQLQLQVADMTRTIDEMRQRIDLLERLTRAQERRHKRSSRGPDDYQ